MPGSRLRFLAQAAPGDHGGENRPQSHQPLVKASKPWRICATYPHLKDSYSLSVNYGIVERARQLGVCLRVLEAGGHPNLERHEAQISNCAKSADVLIVGTVSFDAAVGLLRAKGLTGRVGVLADYFSHGTYRAIKRGKVPAAPTGPPVMQGKIAIDQAVRASEGSLNLRHAGAAIRIVDQAVLQRLDIAESLALAWFKPTFEVKQRTEDWSDRSMPRRHSLIRPWRSCGGPRLACCGVGR